MDKKISAVINKSLAGGEITAGEMAALLSVDHLSEEAFALCGASRRIAHAASGGKAEVHGQVGLDCGPCPQNCKFCSFAADNKVFEQPVTRSAEEILEKSLRLEADGANAIYLMATARYPFGDYLKIAREVKASLKKDTALIANIDDFGEEGARALKKSGFDGIYHVVHMGEGKDTLIRPQTRLNTIAAAQKAGLLIGTAVEPIGPEHSHDEIIEKTMYIRSIKPAHAGTGRRIHIPGSPLAARGQFSAVEIMVIQAAIILALGYGIKGHCGEVRVGSLAGVNLAFAEAGSNPRDTETDTVRSAPVQTRRNELQENGWEIQDGSSAIFKRSREQKIR
jgi:biotin synthase